MALAQKKMGGPYPKSEQRKRREEVFRLHFDYGHSARKISEFLKINRGTVNRDIMFWYADIEKKWRHFDPENIMMKQIERFQIQRTRLRKQLDSVESFQEKITIEKFILNIDMKIADFHIRLIEVERSVAQKIANGVNEWYKKKGIARKMFSPDTFVEVTKEAALKMHKIYVEDKKF